MNFNTTLYNIIEYLYYIFKFEGSMQDFLIVLDISNNKALYLCLPADPGYLYCQINLVVRVESKFKLDTY